MRNQVSETWNSLVRVILQAWASTCLKVEVLWMPNVVCRRRQWHPTPGFLPGKSHGRRSLVDCSPWGCKESDTTEWLHFHFLLSCIGEGNGNPLSVLAWRIPGTGEPGGLPSMGSRLKRLSSSSSSSDRYEVVPHCIFDSHFSNNKLFSRVQLLLTTWNSM